MTIKNITISRFRSIARPLTLELRPLTVLIGANGAGKSNLLDAFAVAGGAVPAHQARAVVRADDGSTLDSERPHERPSWAGPPERWLALQLAEAGGRSVRTTTIDHDPGEELDPRGANLAAYARRLAVEAAPTWHAIARIVTCADPTLRPLRAERVGEAAMLRHGREGLDATRIGAGSWRLLLLACALLRHPDRQGAVVLLDEPETGLNPYALNLLGSMLHTASAHTTVIAATQSARLLDQFDPGDVTVVSQDRAGQTHAQRADKIVGNLDNEERSLGEMWEINVLGGRPGDHGPAPQSEEPDAESDAAPRMNET